MDSNTDIFTNVHIDNDTHIFKNDHLSISIFSRITFSIFSQSVNISTINMSKDIMSYTYIPAHGPEYAILVGYNYYLLVICDAWVTSCDSRGLSFKDEVDRPEAPPAMAHSMGH